MLAAVSRRLLIQISLAFALVASAQAQARQARYDVEAFEPAPQAEGAVLNLYGARTLAPGRLSVSLFGSYAKDPLDVRDPDGTLVGKLVDDVATLQLLGAVGLLERVDVGVALALHHTSAGSDFGDRRLDAASLQRSRLAFGDIRIAPRVSLLEHAASSGFDLALVLPMWLPTGHDASDAGEPFRIAPRVALDFHSDAVLFVVNAGYLIRSRQRLVNSRVDDQVELGLGADVRLAGGLGLLAQFDSRLNVFAPDFGDEDIDSELLGGLRYVAGGFRAQLGAGPGITRALSSPEYRVFAGVSYSQQLSYSQQPHEQAPPPVHVVPVDRDGDGVPDASDRCATEPEDHDGFQDEDGCPDTDNDADGVPDASDRCATEPEDHDGFQDEDGCPDTDNDADGVPDASDRCPLEAGTSESGGCPAPAAPAAPAAAPEPQVPAPVELTQVVHFDKNQAEVATKYDRTLDEVAKLLAEHPEIERVAIEGHADDHGSAALNDRLSRARAESVRATLVKRGVAAGRLQTRGFGSSRPVTGNDTEAQRADNRRVELRVERRSGTQAAP